MHMPHAIRVSWSFTMQSMRYPHNKIHTERKEKRKKIFFDKTNRCSATLRSRSPYNKNSASKALTAKASKCYKGVSYMYECLKLYEIKLHISNWQLVARL